MELYLPFDLSESKLFLNVFFLLDVYNAVLNNIPQEFFFDKEPGVVFFDVSLIGFIDESNLKEGSLIFFLPVLRFFSLIKFIFKNDPA